MPTRLAVIPAKGRSTRLPGKNLAPLAGRPMVLWTIEAAVASRLFDHVVVSTDDARIADVARAAGAEVPFTRRASLTVDGVEVDAVVRDALSWQHDHGAAAEWVCTLQPTSPLRRAEHIVAAWDIVAAAVGEVDAVVSVSPYDHPIEWALAVEDHRATAVDPARCTASRSHLPTHYHPDGFIYWQRAEDILAGRGLHAGRVRVYHTPRDVAVDIDEPQDLAFAEWLMTRGSN